MLRCYNEETRREIHGQVAQLVERSPEKAGVGGSSPSLATSLKSLVYSLRPRIEKPTKATARPRGARA